MITMEYESRHYLMLNISEIVQDTDGYYSIPYLLENNSIYVMEFWLASEPIIILQYVRIYTHLESLSVVGENDMIIHAVWLL